MWTWLRYAAELSPGERQLAYDQLGGDAGHFFRLLGDIDNVKQGPQESLIDYYRRLKSVKDNQVRENVGDRPTPAPFSLTKSDEEAAATGIPDWLVRIKRERGELPPEPATRQSDLPARDPGWWTSPWSESRQHGVPPMPQRLPGDTLRPTHNPGYAPEPLSMTDWVQRMRDKGITLNHSLEVPNAARPGDMPPRPHGRDLMEEFSKPRVDPFGRRRASTTVASYIEGVLVEVGERPFKIASLEGSMAGEGWHYHKSGSGNWYQNDNLGGKVHIIEQQPDGGWIHNSGPTEDEMSEHPRGFDSLEQAMLHARGIGGSYHAEPPKSINKMNSRG